MKDKTNGLGEIFIKTSETRAIAAGVNPKVFDGLNEKKPSNKKEVTQPNFPGKKTKNPERFPKEEHINNDADKAIGPNFNPNPEDDGMGM